jgi:hypothetical protein
MRVGIQVAKYGSNTVPAQGMGRSYKGKRRNDDFTRETERLNYNFKANCGIADSNTVLYLDQSGDPLLKFVQ